MSYFLVSGSLGFMVLCVRDASGAGLPSLSGPPVKPLKLAICELCLPWVQTWMSFLRLFLRSIFFLSFLRLFLRLIFSYLFCVILVCFCWVPVRAAIGAVFVVPSGASGFCVLFVFFMLAICELFL